MGGLAPTKQFARLFMAPGMAHCGGGVGPSWFDRLGPVIDWVEKQQPPERIIAVKREDDDIDKLVTISRPLCAYPMTARWKGYGSVRDASSFACADGL